MFLFLRQNVDNRANSSLTEYINAYKAMVRILRILKTNNATISVMHTFGKYLPGQRRNLGTIPVQTTAVSHKKTCLRGRAQEEG